GYFCLATAHALTRSSFPYTTLFRSLIHRAGGDAIALIPGEVSEIVQVYRLPGAVADLPIDGQRLLIQRAGAVVILPVGGHHAQADRKSTRLNSSHQIIS